MNEGFLGKYTFGGERAATDDHPAVIHYLPLAASVAEKLDVGLLLKAVDVYGATAVVGAENTGVTAASVTPETLAAKVNNVPGAYTFSYDSQWKLGDNPATITEYGVSLTGEPASGDTVTVTLAVADVTYEPALAVDASRAVRRRRPAVRPHRGERRKKSVAAVVHGTVKTRVLKTGDGVPPTGGQIAALARHGVFAV